MKGQEIRNAAKKNVLRPLTEEKWFHGDRKICVTQLERDLTKHILLPK